MKKRLIGLIVLIAIVTVIGALLITYGDELMKPKDKNSLFYNSIHM